MVSDEPYTTQAHRPAKLSTPNRSKISESTAIAPLPDNGFTKISGAISLGMPVNENNGARIEDNCFSSPLTSKSLVSIVTETIYGKMDVTKGIAFLTPFVKLSYIRTFLNNAKANDRRKSRGTIMAKT